MDLIEVESDGFAVFGEGNVGAIEEEDSDGSDSDVSKAFTVTSLRQDGRGEEEGEVVGNGETVEEGASSARLGSWKQRRWWRKGSSREWHRLRCWQRSFAAAHATTELTMGATDDKEKGSGYLCRRWLLHAARSDGNLMSFDSEKRACSKQAALIPCLKRNEKVKDTLHSLSEHLFIQKLVEDFPQLMNEIFSFSYNYVQLTNNC
ncbi:hypothetical protein GW17_00057758 [Ensete ventricosum]|nr:hypothetical protein GW17_00057758 [Ensete ventricosum]